MAKPVTAHATFAGRDDYQWLTSPAAAEWLDWAAASRQSLTAQVEHLRGRCTSEQTHLVLEQITLRRKARTKFAAATRMFFTPRGLEQATDEIVAAHKAARFIGRKKIFDLCSGIGGDLLALAQRGETVGVDRDPIMATIARANGRLVAATAEAPLARGGPEVCLQDVGRLDLAECAAWHIDPDRRPSGRRTTLVGLHEPGMEVMEKLLAQNPHAAIKLAPAAQLLPHWLEQAETEWISRGRECRQLVAWFGDLAGRPGTRSASVLGAKSGECRTVTGRADLEPPLAAAIGPYLFEPDAAVLAANLGGALAVQYDLAAIAPGAAYWTGNRIVSDAALGCFEVRDVLPFRFKALKDYLRERGIGQLEIKKRGVDRDPAELRRQLNLAGPESATLLLARIDKRIIAIIARRLD
ncbi:MAG: SAM-dependent methyltransferase [Planctomycetia bacterium]|nr:SAM-dependent methyltransferase [Planctomycetia bacterium]